MLSAVTLSTRSAEPACFCWARLHNQSRFYKAMKWTIGTVSVLDRTQARCSYEISSTLKERTKRTETPLVDVYVEYGAELLVPSSRANYYVLRNIFQLLVPKGAGNEDMAAFQNHCRIHGSIQQLAHGRHTLITSLPRFVRFFSLLVKFYLGRLCCLRLVWARKPMTMAESVAYWR